MIVALKTLAVLAVLAAYAAVFTPMLVASVRSFGGREIGYRYAFKVMIYSMAWKAIAGRVFGWVFGEPDAWWVSALVSVSAGIVSMAWFLVLEPKLSVGRAAVVSGVVVGTMAVVGFVIGVVAVLMGWVE